MVWLVQISGLGTGENPCGDVFLSRTRGGEWQRPPEGDNTVYRMGPFPTLLDEAPPRLQTILARTMPPAEGEVAGRPATATNQFVVAEARRQQCVSVGKVFVCAHSRLERGG